MNSKKPEKKVLPEPALPEVKWVWVVLENERRYAGNVRLVLPADAPCRLTQGGYPTEMSILGKAAMFDTVEVFIDERWQLAEVHPAPVERTFSVTLRLSMVQYCSAEKAQEEALDLIRSRLSNVKEASVVNFTTTLLECQEEKPS